jgi:hypothetical protein
MAGLDFGGLKPLDEATPSPAAPAGLDFSSLKPIDFSGLQPVSDEAAPEVAATAPRRQPQINLPREVPEPPPAIRRGMKRMGQAGAFLGTELGLVDPQASADYIAEREAEIAKIPPPESVIRFGESKTFGDAWANFLDAPGEIALSLAGESLGMTAPAMAAGAGVAALGGGIWGLAAVSGLGSFAQEYAGKFLDSFKEKGIDVSKPEQVANALTNPELMGEIRGDAAKKGVAIGFFDALSARLGGHLVKGAKGVLSFAGRGSAELAEQGALGMTGEVAGELAAGEEINPASIMAEGIAEIPGGVGDVALGTMARARDAARGQPEPEVAPQTAQEAAADLAGAPGQTTVEINGERAQAPRQPTRQAGGERPLLDEAGKQIGWFDPDSGVGRPMTEPEAEAAAAASPAPTDITTPEMPGTAVPPAGEAAALPAEEAPGKAEGPSSSNPEIQADIEAAQFLLETATDPTERRLIEREIADLVAEGSSAPADPRPEPPPAEPEEETAAAAPPSFEGLTQVEDAPVAPAPSTASLAEMHEQIDDLEYKLGGKYLTQLQRNGLETQIEALREQIAEREAERPAVSDDIVFPKPGSDRLVTKPQAASDFTKAEALLKKIGSSGKVPPDLLTLQAAITAPLESVKDGRVGNPEFARYIEDVHTVLDEGYRALNVPSGRRVLKAVLSALQDDKVFRGVVSRIPVEVMDLLSSRNGTPGDLRRNRPVFINALSAHADLAVGADVMDSVIGSLASLAVEVLPVDKARRPNDVASAAQTGKRNGQWRPPSVVRKNTIKGASVVGENTKETPAEETTRLPTETPAAKLARVTGQPIAAVAKKRPSVDVMTFVARNGGVRDDEGHELKTGRNFQRFVPGTGNVIRANGNTVDALGEKLWEADYFGPMATTPRPTPAQVLDLLDRAARSKVYAPDDAALVEEARSSSIAEDREEAARDDIRLIGREMGQPFSAADEDAILALMAKERGSAFAAVESFVERLALQAQDAAVEAITAARNEIPTDAQGSEFDIPLADLAPARPEAAPGEGEARREAKARDRGEAGSRAGAQSAGREGAAPRVERTAAGDQTILPGAEGSAAQAYQKGQESQGGRLKASARQKGADEGLFGDGHKQTDLLETVDLATRPSMKGTRDAEADRRADPVRLQGGMARIFGRDEAPAAGRSPGEGNDRDGGEGPGGVRAEQSRLLEEGERFKAAAGERVEAIKGETLAERSKRLASEPVFRRWFGRSKVVDESGTPKVVFRGDWRGDKLGDKFKVKLASSGRFYFTEDPAIASSYSVGKQHLRDEDADYGGWFTFPGHKAAGERTAPTLNTVWYRLSAEEKARVQDALLRAQRDDDNEIVFSEDPGGGIASRSQWDREVRAAGGNWLQAAKSIWLESGAIFGEEGDFQAVLKHAGLRSEFDNPQDPRSTVTPVYLSIQNPIDTTNVPADFLEKMTALLKGDRTRAKPTNDQWDKAARTPKVWLDELAAEIAKHPDGNLSESHVWTSIPERVTEAMQRLGYDGIDDRGGKMGGPGHRVWIAFEPNQIKSVLNKGAFSRDTDKIMGASGSRRRAAAGGEAASPADRAKLAAVEAEFQRLADQMFPGLKVKMTPKPLQIAGRARELIAAYQMSPALGAIASISMATTDGRKRSPEEMATLLGHEGIHHLVETGIIPRREWEILRSAARKQGWRDAYRIDERYPAETDSERDEEAVAHAFGAWMVDGREIPPGVRSIFQRIRLFLERLGQWLRGNGYEARFERIFGQIKNGAFLDSAATAEARKIARTVAIKDARIAGMLDEQQAADKRPAGLKLAQSTASIERLKAANGPLIDDVEGGEIGPDRLVADLGGFRATFFDPRMIATEFPDFTATYQAAAKQQQLRDALVWKYRDMTKAYFDLSSSERANVDKVLELGALQYETWGGPSIRAVNNGRIDQGGKAALSSAGDTITLSEKESAAYNSMRRMYDAALDDFRDVLLVEQGIDVTDPNAPKTSKQLTRAAIRASRAGEQDQASNYRFIAKIVEEVEDAKRWGYFPFSRYGRVAIVVQERKKEVGIGHDGGQSWDWETIERHHFEVDSLKERTKRAVGAATPFLDMPAVKSAYETLLLKHANNPNVKVGKPHLMTPADVGTEANAADVDVLLEAAGIGADTREEIMGPLQRFVQARSFKKHFFRRRNIQGYSTDFERVTADYIIGISNYLARRRTHNDWEAAFTSIDQHKPALRRYATAYREYFQNPKEEWQRLRQITALYTMGPRISTVLVNMSQVPVMTVPHLSKFAPAAVVSKEIGKAYAQTTQMLGKRSLEDVREGKPFDLSKAPADIRAELMEMEREGIFMPSYTFELMATAKNRTTTSRGAARTWQKAAEWWMMPYATAETENRLVTAMAALRLAKRPDMQARVERITKDDPNARAELAEWSPLAFAEWSVKETQFVMGKINRARIGRGMGAPVMVLRGFTMQAFERLWKLSRLYGARGRVELLAVAVMLVLFSGLNGLPAMQNAIELIDWIVSKLRGQDFDMRRQIREWLAEMTSSPKAAEAISNGFTRYLGIDTERRVGLGSVPFLEGITGALSGRMDVLDVIGSISVPLRIGLDIGNAALDAIGKGEPGKLGSALLPIAVKDLIAPMEWSDPYEGNVRSGTTGLTAIPKSRLSAWDYVARSIGFTPSNIANIREAEWAANRETRAVAAEQSRRYREIARAEVAAERATALGNPKIAAEFTKRAAKVRADIEEANKGRPESRKIIINPTSLARIREQERVGNAIRSKTAPVKTRGERARIENIYGVGRAE